MKLPIQVLKDKRTLKINPNATSLQNLKVENLKSLQRQGQTRGQRQTSKRK